jgi:hypothetical protein
VIQPQSSQSSRGLFFANERLGHSTGLYLQNEAAMVYAILLCTYVAALPHVSNCQLLGAVDRSLVIFDDKQKCEQAAERIHDLIISPRQPDMAGTTAGLVPVENDRGCVKTSLSPKNCALSMIFGD